MIREGIQEDKFYQRLKGAITRCDNALEISFMRPADDVYGKDIDLTARLLDEAAEGEIIMNERYFLEATRFYETQNHYEAEDEFAFFQGVEGPWTQNIRGFSEPLELYKLRVKRDTGV